MKKALKFFAVLALGFTSVQAVAVAGGSDSPTPYTVDANGVTLPEGDTFRAHGHVNIKWVNPTGSAGIHFDPFNNQPGGAWIGKDFIPWSAFGVPDTACVTWVQISHYNEHYGEGGQDPVCLTVDEPEVPEDETPEDEVPEDEVPEDEVPEDEVPEDEIPEDDTPDVPEDDTPEDDTPEQEIPEDDTPEDDTPKDDVTEDDTPEDDTTEDDTPKDEEGTTSKRVERSVDCQLLLSVVTTITDSEGKTSVHTSQRWITKKKALKIDPDWSNRCGDDEIIIIENG